MPCHVYNPDADIRLNVEDSPVGLGGILEQPPPPQKKKVIPDL